VIRGEVKVIIKLQSRFVVIVLEMRPSWGDLMSQLSLPIYFARSALLAAKLEHLDWIVGATQRLSEQCSPPWGSSVRIPTMMRKSAHFPRLMMKEKEKQAILKCKVLEVVNKQKMLSYFVAKTSMQQNGKSRIR
jgi:hypothetical protein